ncbi:MULTISPECIES: deoxyribose-phosphate aldolase [unclassified Actinobaculum]|uniref:deoxyribose-phosphate aldolase n=1 Tax=unclassified Actinobaculum TaxID=2609299 RepID=UPI000D528169|nr:MULTISPECIES: deoxyribose-phosphate aldolase [unclassified Actinobaculum]AWE41742.1 deoxyribose-phosphate aldolase [Actinobaculum sp. 313]RTE50345.1 deoxyribose-phosphate aldolase [Actinobaculum sp. 352]
MQLTREEFLQRNDHSLLKPTLTYADLRAGLEFAAETGCGAVCISPHRLALASEVLKGTDVRIATVVGFPTGTHATRAKVDEAKQVIDDGAVALDMVMDIGAMLSGDETRVRDDVAAVVEAAAGTEVKVILEVDYLSDEQIVRAAQLCAEAGANYVKTSTGFVAGGANAHNIGLMRGAVPDSVKIKASGGLSSLADVQAVFDAGADRWGISRTKQILAEF